MRCSNGLNGNAADIFHIADISFFYFNHAIFSVGSFQYFSMKLEWMLLYITIKYKPGFDDNGDPIHGEPNKVRFKWDLLQDCSIYIDDVSCGTKNLNMRGSTATLSFHIIKLNAINVNFGNYILDLGCIISHVYMIPDPEERRQHFLKQRKKNVEINNNVDAVREINTLVP